MTRKSRTVSAPSSNKPTRRKRLPIAEPFQVVSSTTVTRGTDDIKVPMLVLYGEWLKAVGFPIGSTAYLVADEQGELALKRFGIRLPRRLVVRTMPR